MVEDQLPQVERTTPKSRSFYFSGSIALLIFLGGVGGLFYNRQTTIADISPLPPVTVSSTDVTTTSTVDVPPSPPPIIHVAMPEEVRGIYWTGNTAGTKRVESLMDYASSSRLNTVVMDIKMDDGSLAFVPNDPALEALTPKKPVIRDLDGLLVRLKDRGLYRVARIAVMRDRVFGELHPDTVLRTDGGGIWHDRTGMPWLDPASPKVAEYSLALAREAYARGFDEIQFDYVRFASDGVLSAIRYPVYDGRLTKSQVMREYFKVVGGTLQSEKIPVSFDLFGLTFVNNDGLGIGQRLTDVYPYADFVSPMAYPSHYAKGFQGFANPALYPYEVVKHTLDSGIGIVQSADSSTTPEAVKLKSRPWIQDFDLGAVYDAAKVQAQIKAARDAGASGWMLWNAANVYTPTKYIR